MTSIPPKARYICPTEALLTGRKAPGSEHMQTEGVRNACQVLSRGHLVIRNGSTPFVRTTPGLGACYYISTLRHSRAG